VPSTRSTSRRPEVRLQQNTGLEQLSDLPPRMTVETLGEDFDVGPDAFVDTAAAIENLDLIIYLTLRSRTWQELSGGAVGRVKVHSGLAMATG
jgi:hypothetical protein